jgi:MarR family transcriptional regulator, temperature-dependent positive regulator of motility
MNTRNASPLDRSPIHLLRRASQAADLAFATRTKGKLTPRQLAVLIAIEEYEGLNQTNLGERTGIDRASMTDVIDQLRRKRWIRRRRSREDARAFAVTLTDDGRHVLRAVMPIAVGVDRSVLSALPTERRKPFMDALASIVIALERPAS